MQRIQSPRTDDDAIEQLIKDVGADVAPRITPVDIEANIGSEHYFTAGQGRLGGAVAQTLALHPDHVVTVKDVGDNGALDLLTFCVLVLKNGFTVTGKSACASPENFNAEVGRKMARANAVSKIWPLMGYALKSELARPHLTEADAAADLAGTPRPDHPTL